MTPLGNTFSDRRTPGQGRIAGEMARAIGSLRALRSYLWVMAGASTLWGILPYVGVSAEFSPGSSATGVIFHLGIGCFLALAALFVERKPVAWTLACAIVLTAMNTTLLVRGWIPGILPMLVTVMSWVAIPKAGALERLLVLYPDLRFARRLRPRREPSHLKGALADARPDSDPDKTLPQ